MGEVHTATRLRLAVDGRPLECSIRLAYGGADQLTLSTVMPQLAVDVHTSFLGHPEGDTAISHVQLQPGADPVTVTELDRGRALQVREARRLCPYRHLAVLREQIAEHTGAVVTVEVADRALEQIDTPPNAARAAPAGRVGRAPSAGAAAAPSAGAAAGPGSHPAGAVARAVGPAPGCSSVKSGQG